MGHLLSVNVGVAEPNPAAPERPTGIGKRPHVGSVHVRAPGARGAGPGSGLQGDFIGDSRHHGGDDQAVYVYAREDLDDWQRRLSRALPNGVFGENLTTIGVDVNGASLGERWQVGPQLELEVTYGRIPCATFAVRIGEPNWVTTFTRAARPGAYLRVITPGTIEPGDPVEVVDRPGHDVTVALAFRAVTLEPDLLRRLPAAEEFLDERTRRRARRHLRTRPA